MGISVLRVAGRLLTPVVAAALLAGVSLDAVAGGKGVIKLVTNNESGLVTIYFVDTQGNTTQTQDFSIARGTKCIVDEGGWVNRGTETFNGAPSLVDITAKNATGKIPAGQSGVGLFDAGLGVFNGSNGTGCSRFSDAPGEALTVTSLKGAFDKLELDVEAKGSAVFEVQIDNDKDKVYRLYTGRNIQETLGDREENCDNGSDSGPDSGIGDQCYWIIKDVGVSFTIKAVVFNPVNGVVGEGTLEGGGDYVTSLVDGDYSTKIHLTSLIDVGTLGCRSDNNTTAEVFSDDPDSPAASCKVTRVNTSTIEGGKCTQDIAYRLETFTANNLCALDKTNETTDPLAGLLEVAFTEEYRTDWGVEKTGILFTGYNGSNGVGLYATRCSGTIVYDQFGSPTIAEVVDQTMVGDVLTTALKGIAYQTDRDVDDDSVLYDFVADQSLEKDFVYLSDRNDEVPGNGYIDWACILDHSEEYVGGEKQVISQRTLFWGDVSFNRGSAN